MAMQKKKSDGSVDAKARKQALDSAISHIQKRCGAGAIMRMGDVQRVKVPAVSTGALTLDIALGVGGVPMGRVVEIFGPEASGKTTLALQLISSAQRAGGTAAFIDAEHALDPTYARTLGVNTDDMLISQPDYGEQALDIADTLVQSGAVDIIVVDSVAALVPKAELEGDMGDHHVGLQARLMSQAMRKLTGVISRSSTLVVFINQIREKVGVMFGSPETTPGGRALKYYSSVRLDVRRIGQIKDGDRIVGARTRVKVVKNKVAPPFQQAEFDLIYGKGVSWVGTLVDVALQVGVVEKSGSWFSFGDVRLGQGKERSITFIRENRDVLADLEKKVLALTLRADDKPAEEQEPAKAPAKAEAPAPRDEAPARAQRSPSPVGATAGGERRERGRR